MGRRGRRRTISTRKNTQEMQRQRSRSRSRSPQSRNRQTADNRLSRSRSEGMSVDDPSRSQTDSMRSEKKPQNGVSDNQVMLKHDSSSRKSPNNGKKLAKNEQSGGGSGGGSGSGSGGGSGGGGGGSANDDNSYDNICAICRSDITDLAITNCNHRFCRECISHWTQGHSSCPTCRSTISTIRINILPSGTFDTIDVSRAEILARKINETHSMLMLLFTVLAHSLLPEVNSTIHELDSVARDLNIPTTNSRAARAAAAESNERTSSANSDTTNTESAFEDSLPTSTDDDDVTHSSSDHDETNARISMPFNRRVQSQRQQQYLGLLAARIQHRRMNASSRPYNNRRTDLTTNSSDDSDDESSSDEFERAIFDNQAANRRRSFRDARSLSPGTVVTRPQQLSVTVNSTGRNSPTSVGGGRSGTPGLPELVESVIRPTTKNISSHSGMTTTRPVTGSNSNVPNTSANKTLESATASLQPTAIQATCLQITPQPASKQSGGSSKIASGIQPATVTTAPSFMRSVKQSGHQFQSDGRIIMPFTHQSQSGPSGSRIRYEYSPQQARRNSTTRSTQRSRDIRNLSESYRKINQVFEILQILHVLVHRNSVELDVEDLDS